jgi:RNase P/RNase MRP subunit POP5
MSFLISCSLPFSEISFFYPLRAIGSVDQWPAISLISFFYVSLSWTMMTALKLSRFIFHGNNKISNNYMTFSLKIIVLNCLGHFITWSKKTFLLFSCLIFSLWVYLMKIIPETRRTWWRLFQKHVVPDEGYSSNTSYPMKIIPETRRTWWRLFQQHVVPDEDYSRNTLYLMKVIPATRRTRWRLFQKHVVPDEDYSRNTSYLMKVIPETRRTW